MSQIKGGGRERVGEREKMMNEFTFPLLFCSIQALSGLVMPTHTGEGRSSLISLLIQILFFSRNTLTDTARSNVLLASRAPLAYSN